MTSVGTATIAAAIGAGGLGTYVFRGIATVDTRLILAGAVPAAALALTVDALLARVERSRRPARAASALAAAVVIGLVLLALSGRAPGRLSGRRQRDVRRGRGGAGQEPIEPGRQPGRLAEPVDDDALELGPDRRRPRPGRGSRPANDGAGAEPERAPERGTLTQATAE